MRRGLAILVVFAAAVGLASQAWGVLADQGIALVKCGSSKTFTFLFWPNGHPAIASVKFPKFAVPHLEAYAGTNKKYPNSANVGGLSSKGQGGFTKACTAASLSAIGPFQTHKTTTQQTALVCKFSTPPLHEFVRLSAGGVAYVVIATPSNREVVYATLKPKGSSLVYEPSVCRPTPSPK